MKIKSIHAIGLYGRININVVLNTDLSILVGINGSGKTSAIKLIDWLLAPNYRELSSVEYEKIALEVEVDGALYRIDAMPIGFDENNILSKALTVTCLSRNGNEYAPIIFADYNKGIKLNYFGFRLDDKEQKTHDFIKSLGNPLIISLDRKITAEIDDKIYREGISLSPKRQDPRSNEIVSKTPLDYVQNIFRQNYARQQAMMGEIDARLRKEIILATLNRSPISEDRSSDLLTFDGFYKFAFKSRQIMLNSGLDQDIQSALNVFLEESYKKLKLQSAKTEQKEHAIDTELEATLGRVDALMMAFRVHGFRRRRASQTLDRYIHAVNVFLNDTGKMIFVERETGELKFKHTAEIENTQGYNLNGLSSGELQILIIFGLFGLNDKQNGVFIIDEPELSLHPKWQSHFMNNIQFLSQGNAQLIVATHSPEIVGSKKQKCVIVK